MAYVFPGACYLSPLYGKFLLCYCELVNYTVQFAVNTSVLRLLLIQSCPRLLMTGNTTQRAGIPHSLCLSTELYNTVNTSQHCKLLDLHYCIVTLHCSLHTPLHSPEGALRSWPLSCQALRGANQMNFWAKKNRVPIKRNPALKDQFCFVIYGQESPGWITLYKLVLIFFFENIQKHQFFWKN